MTTKAISLLLLILLCLSSAKNLQKLIDYTSKYNTFIADVYQELLKSHPSNFVACPLSVNILLALCSTAAKEKTLEQLSAALRLPKRFQDIHDIFEPLTSRLRGPHNDFKLVSANKMYVSNDLRISDQFRSVATKVYDVDIQNVNLYDTNGSVKEINEWVQEKMYNTIKDVVEPNDLINSTHTVLVSAMLFGGRWAQPFYRSSTEKSCFYVSRKKCIVTDTMKDILYRGIYYEIPKLDVRILELPYKWGDVSLFIVLPNQVEGLAAVEARVGEVLVPPERKLGWVEVTLPKFKIETNIEMKRVVEALGVSKAFEAGANFRGFGLYKNNTLIDKIIQKVSIDIDEDGTTASVVESVNEIGYSPGPLPFVKFFVDRPFLFYIRLNHFDLVKVNYNIFVGRYVSP